MIESDSVKRVEQMMDQALAQYYETGEYHYPIVPGMEEWTMTQDRTGVVIDVISIPEAIVQELSNKQLLRLTVENPNVYLANAYPFHVFVQRFSTQFNGLQVLLTRDGVVPFLLDEYLSIPIDRAASDRDHMSPFEGRNQSASYLNIRNFLLEGLLAIDETYAAAILDQRFLQNVAEKYEVKLNSPENSESRLISLEASRMIVVPTLKQAGLLPIEVKDGQERYPYELIIDDALYETLSMSNYSEDEYLLDLFTQWLAAAY
ncbi:hypothetical protein OLMES_3791 [Oleiphilus messinensis]|uniref:Uncharacterized protein n=2 Tax=Oleiphilus messinensis TaxID=141451 RepID=A0A1Y0IBF5_9GAMM|nr:hypothetical protein OLMES_3791 [Oleiphilus messinensis]